jgi:N-acetyl-alpha-D-glucosaminyl L-malate synthase BshA
MMTDRPLTIGITCFPLIGGSGILATALGMELAARGHEVHFFSYAKPVRLDTSAPRIHFHEVPVVQNTLFPCADYTLPLAVKMAHVGRVHRLDVFHVHYAVPHAIAALLAVQMIGASAPKILTTLHGTDTSLLGRDIQYRAAIEHALFHSDAVTTVSESLRRETEETFRSISNIEVVPNFFTPAPPTRNSEQVRRELGISDEFLIVHMSNLRRVKRIDLLLRAFASARERERMRLLVLAGESFARYEPMLDELGIRTQVIIRENGVAIEDYLQAADAGLYTSEVESFGLSILETMFFAKPVVAFSVGGVPEVVGDAGSLHNFGDITGMAAALDLLARSPDAAHRMGERGRTRAEARFSAANIVPQYESVYRRVTSE